MAFMIGNIGNAGIFDPISGAMKGVFTRMESIILDVDSKLSEQYAGSGMYPVVNISADRKPKVTIKGPELPLGVAADILGANLTKATSGAPVQVPRIEEKVIDPTGKVTLDYPISATVTQVSVIGLIDGKIFTAAASAPTAGQFQTPTNGATQIVFNTEDAGKIVAISYTFDSTTGGKIDIATTAIPGTYKFIANAQLLNTVDQSKVPIAFVVNMCQLTGNWQISEERQKLSQTNLDLTILDPGGGLPAISIIPTANFA
jgi:hypothetical protein